MPGARTRRAPAPTRKRKPASPVARRAAASPGDATALANLRWAEAFVAALVAGGVRDVVVSPGSRSTPLVLALARSALRAHVALDERAGGYFALGLARAARRPVALVCTSGTAPANYFPAILEARHARVPLLALTADRPPELRGVGAPQTIDQIALYGGAVRWFCEAGDASDAPRRLAHVAAVGARAVATAWGPPAGPVHVNFPFREPLAPEPATLARTAAPKPRAPRGVAPEAGAPSRRAVQRIARALASRARGLILCGPDDFDGAFAAAAAALAEATGWPILADPLSGLRYGPHDRSRVLGGYDAFLRFPALAERLAPDAVVQFGAALTSKAFHGYLARHAPLHVLVDEGGEWRDPSRRAAERITADPAATARALATALRPLTEPELEWADAFGRAEAAARRALERRRDAEGPEPTEGGLFPELFEAMPEGATLYVGNSMPVRDLDLHVPGSAKRVRVLGNRGVSGIDGVLSSALGASAAGDGPVLAVIGDLSLHHDLNAMAALREGRAAATIVVVNNDGGGIFSFLPVARHDREGFERFFGTPHGLDFAPLAALYGVPHARPATWEALRDAVASSLAERRSALVEVRTERARNAALHREASEAIGRELEMEAW
ncbi:MAG: 2-succinyl-5-enolpyruvyl-6-hydroxy-3-cyclohexene-1-carboxylic-acid synthase [Hyphomicrobiales bacterium]